MMRSLVPLDSLGEWQKIIFPIVNVFKFIMKKTLGATQRWNAWSNASTAMDTKIARMARTNGIVVRQRICFVYCEFLRRYFSSSADAIDSTFWDHLFRKRPAARSDDLAIDECGKFLLFSWEIFLLPLIIITFSPQFGWTWTTRARVAAKSCTVSIGICAYFLATYRTTASRCCTVWRLLKMFMLFIWDYCFF